MPNPRPHPLLHPIACACAAETLPSCAFFTFFNTHQSLNCVAMTSDAAVVAGGFADSSVRLYNLQARAAAAAAAAAAAGGDAGEAAAGGTGGSNRKGGGGAADDGWVTYFTGHSGPVCGLDFSPDNQLLYSASADGTVRCVRAVGAPGSSEQSEGAPSPVHSIRFDSVLTWR